MTGGVERQHQIDHGEAGPDEQCRIAAAGKLRHGGACFAAPGIANEAIAGRCERPKRLGLLIADGEDQSFGPDRLSTVELDAPLAVLASAADRRRLEQLNMAAGMGLLENLSEVAREQSALGESAPVSAFGLEPLGEMIGLTGPGAHALGADVEEVGRLGGGVSDSATHPAASVDQDRVDAPARQMRGKDRSRKPAPDNGNRDSPVRFHNRASSPGPTHRLGAWSCGRTCGSRSCPPSE